MTTKKMARKRPERKFKERLYSKVIMPIASWGICQNQHCSSLKKAYPVEMELGNGVCVRCFDKGLERRGNK